MFFVSFIIFTILIPLTQSSQPILKLKFDPNNEYFTEHNTVDIICELINPAHSDDTAQLWYVDLKTGRHTSISRTLILHPTNDAPDIFRQNSNKRIEFLRKNHIRIQHLQLEDSAQYECSCPDCEQQIEEDKRILQVMKLNDPQLHIEPEWRIQENAKTTIRCTADNFYPYVNHRIVHNHHEMKVDSKVSLPESQAFPHRFSWEAVVHPTAEWHNTTLRCTVNEGNTERHAMMNLEVVFTPRFLNCTELQLVNLTQETASIQCMYAGNPAPTLAWFHQTNEKPVKAGPGTGITIETIDEHHGKYRSILTFDREKLTAIPITTTTTTTTTVKTPNGKLDTTLKPKATPDNYYLQILNDGFIVKIMLNNEEKASQKINIFTDESKVRSKSVNSSAVNTKEYLSTSIIFSSSLTALYMIQRH